MEEMARLEVHARRTHPRRPDHLDATFLILQAQLDEQSATRANGVEQRMRAEVADIASQLARVECIADFEKRRHEAQLARLFLENMRLRRELCAARAAGRAALRAAAA